MGDIGGAAQAGASIVSAGIAANAAKKAAQQNYDAQMRALGLGRDIFGQEQANISPYLASGRTALDQLTYATTQPGGALAYRGTYPSFSPTGTAATALNPALFAPTGTAATALNPAQFQATGAALRALNPATPFTAPTAAEAAATPGYGFTFDEGMRALQAQQAATGRLGGPAAKEAIQYGQGLASTNYGDAYTRALSTYNINKASDQAALSNQLGLYGTNLTAAQAALAGQTGLYGTNLTAAQAALANQQGLYGTNYDVQRQGLNDAYQRLYNIAGLGQTAASQLASAGGQYGALGTGALGSMGQAQGLGTVGAGSSLAAGLTGAVNALAPGLSQIPNPFARVSAGPSYSSYGGPGAGINPSGYALESIYG
jgi:hypothetical protein